MEMETQMEFYRRENVRNKQRVTGERMSGISD